ncbi:E3 ubiquitin-protein ligase [Nymphaea thermarum]|nr:E3 ubiquitin-protein ligase [Nymphaea thermarum]
MTDFSEIQHLHFVLDDDEEDHEEDGAVDLSVQFAFNGYDAKNRPSEGGEPESPFSGHDLLGSPDKSLALDCSVVQNSTEEPSSARHLHQVDLHLGLSNHSSSGQFGSRTDSSVGSLSSVDCGGEYDLGSYYLGLGLGFDDGDWGCFCAQNCQEHYVGHVGGGPESRENPPVDDVWMVEEEFGVDRPVVLAQNSVSSGSVVESGDSSMMLGAQSASLEASASISCTEAADLVDIYGNSYMNDDPNRGIECFGVVGLETDSDEEFLDPQEDGSPIVGRRSNLEADHRSESDASSARDIDYQLCWDCLHFCDQSDSDEDYEWEEVDNGVDMMEVTPQFNSVYGESTSDDVLVHRVLPEVLDLHESSGIEVTDTEANVANGNDTLETTENLDWALLVEVNNLGTSDYDVEDHGAQIQIRGSEDFFPAEVFEILAGQFTNNDSLPRGIQPASKCFVARLPSVSLMVENPDGSRSVCAVCKDEVSIEELVKQLPCSHCYHSSCILPWLSIRSTCPVCRYQLPTDDPDYEQRRLQNPR